MTFNNRSLFLFVTLLTTLIQNISGQVLQYDSVNLKVNAVKKLNTDGNEFAPMLFNSKLYFISDRESDFSVKYTDKRTDDYFYRLYESNYSDSLSFTKPKNVSGRLETKYNVGPVCVTEEGIYATLNNKKWISNNKQMPLQIQFLEWDSNNKKGVPQTISFGLDDSISCAQPCVVGDTLMFFTSNYKLGFGKTDLFYSLKKNNKWQAPVNCGSKVNSEYSESYPYFVYPKLYFSSNRPNGFGGTDVYTIDYMNTEAEPRLMPYPINSKFDDFGFVIDNNLSAGFLSSNRKGTDDIFRFKYNIPEFDKCKEMKNNIYCYTFFEASSLSAKDTIGMTYEWSFGDGTKKRGIEARHCFDGEGKYLIELNVIDKSSGEIFYNEVNYDFDLKNEKQLFIHSADTVKAGYEMVFDSRFINVDSLTIAKRYWNFGDGVFAFTERPKHKYDIPGTYIVKMGIVGTRNFKPYKECVEKKVWVTKSNIQPIYSFNPPIIKEPARNHKKKFMDSMAVYDKGFYNFIIKKERTDSIAIAKRINNKKEKKTREEIVNTKPVIDVKDPNRRVFNTFHGEKPDTSVIYKVHLGSSKNKIEKDNPVFNGLKMISENKRDSMYHYYYGSSKTVSKIIPYYEMAKTRGFKSAVVTGFKNDSLVENPNLRNQYLLIKDTIISDKYISIYFDVSSFEISKTEKEKLLKYFKTFKNLKQLRIVLKGYTDYTGEATANYVLSQQRVDAVTKVLTSLNLSKLKSYYFGGKLTNEMIEHENLQENRKVDITIFYLK